MQRVRPYLVILFHIPDGLTQVTAGGAHLGTELPTAAAAVAAQTVGELTSRQVQAGQ